MLRHNWRRRALAVMVAFACTSLNAADFVHPDHDEFNAVLSAPFAAKSGRWPVLLQFDYPYAGHSTSAAWALDAIAPDGTVVRSWRGIAPLASTRGSANVVWDGRDARGRALAAGYYQFQLRAAPTVLRPVDAGRQPADIVADSLAAFPDEVMQQKIEVMIGAMPIPRMPVFSALGVGTRSGIRSAAAQSLSAGAPAMTQAVAAGGGLPYTIYYGNLHSQTNHSDGGAPVAQCTGASAPQTGVYGPADAYEMMRAQAGGDFLLTSEHNHMFDGSDSTNASAVPATAINLFHSGLQAASDYRAAHPGFLALYGLEWGVISNGGHLNLINVDALAEWELNSSGQLIGEVNTPKSDYPSLYATMKSRGWIGQFNHPASSGQFLVNGTALGYDANGAQVMVLAEVLNSSAFSTNLTQTETGRSSYEAAWNILLERGYHVAPSSDQDNHCANWGLSFTNRTGVLLPTSATYNTTNFLDALRARRVFATEDKSGQLVLTANGHVMGETFTNAGPLTLTANYASSNGQTAQRVQFFEGVPGSNGTVAQLTEGSGSTTFTPASGDHFYYALVTQANGLRLWSAPIWVTEGTGTGDTTPPTVSATESGTSGTITLSATAADNVGVANVEFYVDGVLKGSDASSPYALALDSTTLSNGSHSLTAKAYDAAGNATTSTATSFSVSNSTSDTTPPTVSASESGTSGTITLSATASDNVGVSKVEFYVDGALKASDTTSPYAVTLDSTTLANGSHNLVAKAYDAANNVGTSTTVAFSVSNTTTATERMLNGGFESGAVSWTTSSGVITNSTTYAAHAGTWKAWLNGFGTTHTDYAYQPVTIPATVTKATLTVWLRVVSAETTTTSAYDTLKVQMRSSANAVLITVGTYSNLNKSASYVQRTFDVTAYKGQTVRVYLEGVEDASLATSFLVDDVSLTTQ
jgi:hypothetical protein